MCVLHVCVHVCVFVFMFVFIFVSVRFPQHFVSHLPINIVKPHPRFIKVPAILQQHVTPHPERAVRHRLRHRLRELPRLSFPEPQPAPPVRLEDQAPDGPREGEEGEGHQEEEGEAVGREGEVEGRGGDGRGTEEAGGEGGHDRRRL